MTHPLHRNRRRQVRGIALIEALVGVLIFSVGILGLVGLHVSMTRAQGAAKFRADASNLGAEVVGRAWGDKPNLAKYTTVACPNHAQCKDWQDKVVASLPAGTTTLSADASTGVLQVTVTWTLPSEGSHS
ncbi:MAG TPA: pilus assembly protein PilV, partial [Ramlibacter sp.]